MDKRRTIQLESLKNQFGWKRLKYLFVVNTRKNAIFPLFVMFGSWLSLQYSGRSLIGSVFLTGFAASRGNLKRIRCRSPGYSYWSLKHVLDPGAFSEDYSASAGIVIIALINTLAGFIILGGIIGFVTNLIQSSMEELRRGGSAVHEFNHIVILGGTEKSFQFFASLKL